MTQKRRMFDASFKLQVDDQGARLERRPVSEVTAQELIALRESLRMSRTVFARILCTNARTLGNWGQGRAKPNA